MKKTIKTIITVTVLLSITACGSQYGVSERCFISSYKPLGYEANQGRDITNIKLIDWAKKENTENGKSLTRWFEGGQ